MEIDNKEKGLKVRIATKTISSTAPLTYSPSLHIFVRGPGNLQIWQSPNFPEVDKSEQL